jgi:hypothetical protein
VAFPQTAGDGSILPRTRSAITFAIQSGAARPRARGQVVALSTFVRGLRAPVPRGQVVALSTFVRGLRAPPPAVRGRPAPNTPGEGLRPFEP